MITPVMPERPNFEVGDLVQYVDGEGETVAGTVAGDDGGPLKSWKFDTWLVRITDRGVSNWHTTQDVINYTR